MGVAVVQPRDCLTDLFSRNSITPPHRQKKPTPNRHRRTPPPPFSSFIPKGSKKKNLNHNNNIVSNRVRICEEIGKKIPDLVMIPTQIRASDHMFYAGPVTSTSPPPSEVPLPAFFAKKSVSANATNDLIRILHLDTA